MVLRWVAHAAWHLFGGFQNEGEGSGRGLFDGPKLPVVHPRIVGQFTQVTAKQGQVVLVVHATDAAQLVRGVFVVQVADQGIAGVGGHGQHTALLEQLHGLLEQTGLWVVRVNSEELGHGCVLGLPVAILFR